MRDLPDRSPTLARTVSRWEVVGLAVNAVVGSGIYLLPAAAAALLGTASLVAVAVAALAVGLVVLCFAEAATRFDRAGGAYLYTRAAFGDLVGFEVGWMTWLARVASVASLSAGLAQALSYLWPEAVAGIPRLIAIAGPLVLLTVLNVVGVRTGARTAVTLAVAKVLPLLVLVAVGALAFSPEIFHGQDVATLPTGAGGPLAAGTLGQAALLLLFAFAGFENLAAPAGELRHPRRDIPFALLTHLALVTALYLAVLWVALGTLPGLASSETPLADAAARLLGPWGGALLTVGAGVSILGTLGDSVLSGPRYLYALARDGWGPGWLARVHPRWRTPSGAILFQTAVALPLALSGTFVGLAALSVVARLATYLGTAAAVPVLRRKPGLEGGLEGGLEAGTRDRTFRLPGGPAIPIAATLLSFGLAASATAESLLAAGVALLVGLGVFLGWRRGGRGEGARESP